MRSMLPRKVASVLVRAAHDPPKCERFGDKIMRFFNKMRARSNAKSASTFADRALASRRSLQDVGPSQVLSVNPQAAHLFMICSNIKLRWPEESIAIGVHNFRKQSQW